LDTPGIHKAKNKLGEYMVNVAEGTLSEVDVILWLVEPTDYIGAGEQHILEVLSRTKTPVVLVVNKIDTVDKAVVEKAVETYRDTYPFAAIMTASALRNRNVDQLQAKLFALLPEGPMYYDEDTVTDQPERQIAAEIVREKALRLLDDEIPHGIAVAIERMKERPDGNLVDIDATIICERDSHKGILIGKQGAMLKRIGTEARKEIELLFEYRVNLKLWVKVKKDWRDSDFLLKNYGYVEKSEE
jgi:GTP-binding protein Era